MINHSPLPWLKIQDVIYNIHEHIVVYSVSKDEDAEFIVHCVNHYDKLVAAIKEIGSNNLDIFPKVKQALLECGELN